jgi:hypothetical protein
MKSRLLKALLTAVALCGVQSNSWADAWSDYGKILGVMYYDDGTLQVWADMPRLDPAGCGGDRYIFPAANPRIKESYASLLMAYAAGKSIRLLVRSTCAPGNPSVRVVEVMG